MWLHISFIFFLFIFRFFEQLRGQRNLGLLLNIENFKKRHICWHGTEIFFFLSWGNERPYAQLPLSKIRFFLSIQQLTLWPSKSENFQKFSKFGATFERVPYHLSNLSGWNYLHFYIKFHIKLRNFTDFNIWPPFWPPPIVHFLEWKCHYCPFLQ